MGPGPLRLLLAAFLAGLAVAATPARAQEEQSSESSSSTFHLTLDATIQQFTFEGAVSLVVRVSQSAAEELAGEDCHFTPGVVYRDVEIHLEVRDGVRAVTCTVAGEGQQATTNESGGMSP